VASELFYVSLLSASMTAEKWIIRNIVCTIETESARARKSCDDPNDVKSKCFFYNVSNARTFTTDKALKSFKCLVGCQLV
jgi:hypothetical protein